MTKKRKKTTKKFGDGTHKKRIEGYKNRIILCKKWAADFTKRADALNKKAEKYTKEAEGYAKLIEAFTLKQDKIITSDQFFDFKRPVLRTKWQIWQPRSRIIDLKRGIINIKRQIIDLKREVIDLKRRIIDLKREIILPHATNY